jgi:hypothetical protein
VKWKSFGEPESKELSTREKSALLRGTPVSYAIQLLLVAESEFE